MLENSEGAIKNGQSRETSKIWYTRRRKTNTTNTNTPQYVLDTTMRKQTHITYIRHKPTGGKDHIMFVVCFFNIYFEVHSVAGKKIHETELELVLNVDKER